ncbi:hypothetical protein [Shinella sp. JR1-6]|uniref:hypothetical protein n=1 Tax=Shinella sp. JR1-6 TaxID=2527671 RepID=UPI00102D3FC6|nr:hypothetical protein [Shinella sp. JR1-6]TAA50918.1 hypothetical protein EXZ48_32320 [Shinella sp. JR1-6]
MTPRALMITGAAMGLFGATVAVIRSDVGQFAVFLFAAGAVFGKGYGVYEERTRGAVRRTTRHEDAVFASRYNDQTGECETVDIEPEKVRELREKMAAPRDWDAFEPRASIETTGAYPGGNHDT